MQVKKNKDKSQKNLKSIIPKITPPMILIVGYSGSGKTTLIEKLTSEFKERGFRVGTIKHDVHGFDMDRPGKDSWRHKRAGAATTIITSPKQIGIVMDVDHDHYPIELLPLLEGMDIVLVEGFKRANLPKIEIFRLENGKPPACRGDRNLIAVVSNTSLDWGIPRYAADDFKDLADYIIKQFGLDDIVNSSCKRAIFF